MDQNNNEITELQDHTSEQLKPKRRKRTIDKDKVARGKAKYKEQKKQKRAAAKEGKKPFPIKAILIVLLVLCIIGATGSYFGYQYYMEELANQAKLVEEHDAIESVIQKNTMELVIKEKEKHHKETLGTGSGENVAKEVAKTANLIHQGILNRPPYVDLTAENTANFTSIDSCLINASTGQVEVSVLAKELPNSDDGYYYLFAEQMYENSISGKEPITKVEKDIDFTLSCNLNNNSASSRLFSKFVVAVLKDGNYVAVSSPKYITNPEAIASHSASFFGHASKKGLLVDPAKLSNGSLEDLGVKHAAYNIFLSRILGNTTHGQYPTITYSYNGKTYAFNGHVIDEYDHIFTTLTNKGIEISAIILNDQSVYGASLIHPSARDGKSQSNYYAFNNTNQDGIDAMAAVASFLAKRYSGTGHGKVMNWIVGNEVNVRLYWNYTALMDGKQYFDIYADSLRVFYNAIKSVNGNARIYISLDQVWNQNMNGKVCYDGRDMLDEVSRYIKAEGNVDWCVAFHPYNYPLPAVRAWDSSGNKVVNSADTQIITMKNINVLTNYLQNESLLNSKGEVRRVILSELGYTSSQGQEAQAASYAYCYKKVEKNPYIDSVLLNRQTDHPVEVAQGLALGLDTSGGGHKLIYNVFKHIDKADCDSVTKFARDMIGISSWSQIQ